MKNLPKYTRPLKFIRATEYGGLLLFRLLDNLNLLYIYRDYNTHKQIEYEIRRDYEIYYDKKLDKIVYEILKERFK